RGLGFRSYGNAMCDAMKPWAQQIAATNRPGAANQHEKGCLKRIFNIVLVTEHPPANTQDHWPVPRQECCKRVLVLLFDKTRQERGLAQAGDGPLTKEPGQLRSCGFKVAAHRSPSLMMRL